jgi:hypothetical protein
VENYLSEQIWGLRDKVAKYQRTYDQEPESYTTNTRFPNLKVPIGAGFYLPVKWVKQLNDGNISSYLAHDGLRDTLHIIPIYASLLSSNDMSIGPIPWWFHRILNRPHTQFLQMVKCAHKFDNWGITTNLLHYCEYDNKFNLINAKIRRI